MTARANVNGKDLVYVGWVEDKVKEESKPSKAELISEYETY